MSDDVSAHLRSFGRRHGHRLRPQRQQLLESGLNRLEIVLPKGAPSPTLDPTSLFGPPLGVAPREIWLEIGFGAGVHLAHQAAHNAHVGFIGAEPFVNGIAQLLASIERDALTNIRIFTEDVRDLLPWLRAASIGRVFVLFPDPWPKRRHHKRRLFGPETLDALARVMTDGAMLRFATDHGPYAASGLAAALRHPAFDWPAERAADWRERPADAVETRYEAKARRGGVRPQFFTFIRRPRAAVLPPVA